MVDKNYGKIVVKDNALIDACFNLSLVEQRIMLLAIVEARLNKEFDSTIPIKVTVQSYIEQFDADKKSAYAQIKDAVDSLFSRQFKYFNQELGELSRSRWVQEATYINEQGFVYIYLTNIVIKMIHTLEKQFTKYYLDQVSDFKSKYSIRIYELIVKWLSVGVTEKYEIIDLRNRLGIEDNEYISVSYLKRDVIDKAIQEINDKSNITVQYEQFKSGRTITHIQFKMKLKEQSLKPKKIKPMTPKQIAMFADKLSKLQSFQNHFTADAGQMPDDYSQKIATKLQDTFYQNEWLSFLVEAGFKPR